MFVKQMKVYIDLKTAIKRFCVSSARSSLAVQQQIFYFKTYYQNGLAMLFLLFDLNGIPMLVVILFPDKHVFAKCACRLPFHSLV